MHIYTYTIKRYLFFYLYKHAIYSLLISVPFVTDTVLVAPLSSLLQFCNLFTLMQSSLVLQSLHIDAVFFSSTISSH